MSYSPGLVHSCFPFVLSYCQFRSLFTSFVITCYTPVSHFLFPVLYVSASLCLGPCVLVLFHRQRPSCCFPVFKCSTILILSLNHLFYLASCVPNRFCLIKSLFLVLTFVCSCVFGHFYWLSSLDSDTGRIDLYVSSSISFTY